MKQKCSRNSHQRYESTRNAALYFYYKLPNSSLRLSCTRGDYSRTRSSLPFVLTLIGSGAYSLSRAGQLLLNKLLLKDDAKMRRACAQPSEGSKEKKKRE